MGLTRLALTRPIAILMLIGALLVMGFQGYARLPIDRLPPSNFPNVSVNVNYPGASPRDVEQLIAIPIERAVSGLRGVENISSTSSLGSGRVSIGFSEDTNLDQAAIDVEKRINSIRGQLPADAGAPSVVKAELGAFPILNVVMSGSGRLTTSQLYDLATEVVQPALLSVIGVADVSVSGGRQREIQVQVDPLRLKAFDISMQQIITSLSSENLNAPAGTLLIGDRESNVRFTALTQSVQELKNMVVNRGGGGGAAAPPPIFLKDVAEVTDTYAEVSRFQRFNGEDSIGLTVTKQPEANSIKVADDAKSEIERLGRTLPQGITFKISNDTTHYTRKALNDVQFDLQLAVLITGTVLLLFLHSWRNTLIVLLAIPTSLISTFLVMFFMGFSLNLMSLMALALLIGILVDDSIVVLENIHRHLQLGETPWMAALKGRNEIGLAAMAITFLDVVVYVPIAFMNGNLGNLFRQFGLTIAVATLFSLFISFTLTPMLASRWLKPHGDRDDSGIVAGMSGALIAIAAGLIVGQRYVEAPLGGQKWILPPFVTGVFNFFKNIITPSGAGGGFGGGFGAPAGGAAAGGLTLPLAGVAAFGVGLLLAPLGWWILSRPIGFFMHHFPEWWERGFGGVARAYRAVLPWALRFRILVVLGGVGVLAGLIVLVNSNVIGSEYAPAEDEGQLTVNLRMPPGVSLEATDRVARDFEAILSDKSRFPEVKTLFTSVGGGGGSGRSTSIALELVDREQRTRSVWDVQRAVRELGRNVPDVVVNTSVPSAFGGGGGGGGGNVSVRLVGPDGAVLSQLADQFEALLRRTPGIAEVNNASQAGLPELRASVNRQALTDLGVSSNSISQAMRTAIQGTVATQLRSEEQAQVSVRVMARRDNSGTPMNLEEIPILSNRGVLVRLGQVAKVEQTTGPSQINRADRNRTSNVSGVVTGRPVGDVARDVREGMRSIQIPAGYRATVGGGVQQLDRAVIQVWNALSLSLVLMYMLMAALYESFLYPLIVLLSLPLAMIGALGGLWVTGKTLNIFSLIGIIMLTGLVSKNAILLVDYTNTLRREQGKSVREALLEAGPIRLRPILMTSATLVCSMLPLALGVGPGGETRSPMATVVIGGMLTSTLLTLLFVPALYTYFDDLQGLPRRVKTWYARRRAPSQKEEIPVPVPAPVPVRPAPVVSTSSASRFALVLSASRHALRVARRSAGPTTLVLVFVGLPLLAACGPATQPQAGQQPAQPAAPAGLPVSTARVSRDTLTSTASYGGNIAPRAQVSILPRTAGRLVRLPVDVGQRVQAGDLLAELEHTTIDAQVAQARANVSSAQANLASSTARLQGILAGPKPEDVAVAEAQADAARIRLAQVVAGGRPEDVRSAEAGVVSAQARLDAALAGGRIEDVLAAQAQVESARNRLNQVLAAGRPEDIRAAEASLASARTRLDLLLNPRPEEIQSAQAAYDQAQTRLAQALDAGTGSGFARSRPEDVSTLELRVQRSQAALDKAIADQARPTTGTTPQQLQLAVTQAQIDLQIAQNDLAKARASGPTDWDLRLLQEASESARAGLDRLLRPSPADVAAARATLETAQATLDKLKSVTPFDVESAQQSLNQAEANLQKVRTPDPTTVATAQATLDQAVAALEKAKNPSVFDVESAKASLAQAEASLAGRKNQYTEADRKAAEASVAQAQAAVEQQQAALLIQQTNLAEAFVRAPFDGIISDRAVSEGAVVSTNTTLMTLISADAEIVFSVEEAHIAKFQENAPATFTVNAFPGEQFKGGVAGIFPSADPRSRTFTVKVRPDDPAGRLKAGMFAQLTVTLERRENVPVVPRDAIVLRNDRPYLFTVADNVAAMKAVEIGLQDDRRAEVRSGVQAGEEVVTSGQGNLRDKDPVRIVPAAGAQRASGPAGAQPGAQPGAPAGAQAGQAGQGAPAAGAAGAAGQGAPAAGAAGAAGQGQRPAGTPGAGQPGQAGQQGQR